MTNLMDRMLLIDFRDMHAINGKRISQEDAAELLGYGVESWKSYESGRRDVPNHLIKHIEHYNELKGC